MVKSMTAYGNAEKTENELYVMAEIRSYNSRHLDISLRIPYGYFALEEKIKALITDQVARGRIEMKVRLRNESDGAFAYELNLPKARAYYDSLVELKDQLNLNSDITIDLIVGAGEVLKPLEIDRDLEAWWPVVKNCVNEALGDLVAMRKREGTIIAGDIFKRLDSIEAGVGTIKRASKDLISHYQQRLEDRIQVLTKGIVEIDPGRIAQEAGFLADRSDISEEIVRAGSHIEQFREIMDSAGPAGRKLNFLLQELNREFNTMGSKTEKAHVSHMIVEIKSELEKIREQLQNIE